MPTSLDDLVARAADGGAGGVLLVTGDRVLAEPAANRLAEALAERAGCTVDVRRRPPRLAPLLADLRTFSLFDAAKVVLAVDTGALADRGAAAAFVDDAAAGAGARPGEDLSPGDRQAAVRLLQAIRLFDLDPEGGAPEEVLAKLPDWVFQGAPKKGGRRRTKAAAARLRDDLVPLLAAAREAGLRGYAAEELSELAAAVAGGLPETHVLVLAESAVAADHPVVRALEERDAVLHLAHVEVQRGGDWSGVRELAVELGRQTRMPIARDALAELARRTLRKEGFGAGGAAQAATTARLAAEYRKLANLAEGEGKTEIDRELVTAAVEDRGQADVFAILDAIGEGRGRAALEGLARHLAAAEDPLAARLSFFALLAGFCRNLVAVGGIVRLLGAPRGESSYPRFKNRLAPALQREIDGRKSPLAGLHPYRLHRAYLAAGRIDPRYLSRLPWRLLETELRLKGDSGDPGAALSELVSELATATR